MIIYFPYCRAPVKDSSSSREDAPVNSTNVSSSAKDWENMFRRYLSNFYQTF